MISLAKFCLAVCLLLWGVVARAENIDTEIFRRINGDIRIEPLDKLMEPVTEWSPYVEATVGLVFLSGGLIFGKEKERDAGVLSLAAITTSGVVALGIKCAVERKRPYESLEDVHVVGNTERTPSFPSGHASTAFALATVLASKYKDYKIPLYGYATIVGFSRVYCGHHYPSDVLVGSLLGYGMGKLTLHFEDEVLSFFWVADRRSKNSLLFDGQKLHLYYRF